MLDDALLWEIREVNQSYSSYVFGTIHLNTSCYQDVLDHIETYISQLRIIYTETTLDQVVNPLDYVIADEFSLEDLMNKKKYKRIEKILKKSFSLDLAAFNRILPLLTVQNLALKALGAENGPSIDAGIYQMAKRFNKDYRGLESLDEQLDILSKIPLTYQVQTLVKVSRNVKTFRKTLKRLVKLYELEKIHALFKSSKRELGPIKNLLLYDRNVILANRISEYHQEGAFVVFIWSRSPNWQ